MSLESTRNNTLQFLLQKQIPDDYGIAFFDTKSISFGQNNLNVRQYTNEELLDIVNTVGKTNELGKSIFAKNTVFYRKPKNSNDNKLELIADEETTKSINAHLAQGNKLIFTNLDGTKTTHEVHNLSVRVFTSEEFSALERALNQFFASVQDARKKTMESKEKGGNEVDYKAQYPTVEGAKIKNTNKLPKEQKKLVDPDTIRKTAINIVAKNIAKSATQEKQKQLDQDKEDKIKETELQRSERRQEILNESKENQQEKIAINKEDQKIHAKTKHQKI